MAHRISFASGRAEIAYANATPWHGLGVKVNGLQTTGDMLRHAGMLWTVDKRDLFIGDGSQLVDGFKATVRVDTGGVLGVVTDRYQPIQNTQAAEMMDALVTEGGAHVEVAGALDDGQRCWMLAHIPADFEVVRGDAVKPYALLAWGHDGKHGLAAKLTSVRVVCHNTLTAAGFGGGRWSAAADVYVKHTRNATLRIDEARRALGLLHKQVASTADAYRAMAGISLSDEQARGYFASVFPMPTSADDTTPEYRERLAKWNDHQARMLRLFETGIGHDMPGVAGTAWVAYNAVTEWTDHHYPVLQSGDVSMARTQSVLFGAYADAKRRAFAEAMALAS